MGTRADFYTKNGSKYRWIGSIAWDGYPEGIPVNVLRAKTTKTFCINACRFISHEQSGSFPKRDGWPWPWETSSVTDYAYIFDKRRKCVLVSNFGHTMKKITAATLTKVYTKSIKKKPYFPDMSKLQRVTLGIRSGLITISG